MFLSRGRVSIQVPALRIHYFFMHMPLPASISPARASVIPCACHDASAHLAEDHAGLLDVILAQCKLTAFFQPIVEFSGGHIFGYEGLIRGPADTPLHAPIHLFAAAEALGRLAELERLCRQVVLESFVAQTLPGRLLHGRSPFVTCYFDQEIEALFDPQDLKARGFEGEDRQGNIVFFPLTSLSVGAVGVAPDEYRSHYEVAAAAGEAKKQAKTLPGSALFLERRRPNAARLYPPAFPLSTTGVCN